MRGAHRLLLAMLGCALVVASAPAQENAGLHTGPHGEPHAGPHGGDGITEATQAEPPRAWPGTFAEGFAQMRRLAETQQLESARIVADALLAPNAFLRWKHDAAARGGWRERVVGAVDPLLDLAGWNGPGPDARAEVWHAKGVIEALAAERDAAEAAFWKARATTSDPALQRDAIYDLGVLALQAGEAARAQIPEVSGQSAPALQPPGPGQTPPVQTQPGQTQPGQPPSGQLPGSPGAAQPPDPLEVAREQYLLARERFVERLKSAWQDADTQANVELCLKRLRELDEIERKRKEEEEKQKQEQEKQDQHQDQQKDQEEQEKQDQEQKDQEGEQKDDPKAEDEKEPKDQKEPEPQPGEDEPKKDEARDPQPTEAEEQTMSEAEMIQLLDRLQRIEEEARRIQAQLKAARRAKVKKDW